MEPFTILVRGFVGRNVALPVRSHELLDIRGDLVEVFV